MKQLRVSFLLTGMLVLGASTLSAQSSRISCKDGTRPKIGHFSCWGHGGLVREEVKAVVKPAAKPEKPKAKPAKTAKATKKAPATKPTTTKSATATKKATTTKKATATKPATSAKPREKRVAQTAK
jgi:hypothetical protein